ncbi:hypothetical protein ACUN0C_19650 [Faunimonas sp. B44]|uniref:hypothetical protein n=1 Tax=Faunimonas sp. B44 TaxID=3461493 RepID=UPI0040444B70
MPEFAPETIDAKAALLLEEVLRAREGGKRWIASTLLRLVRSGSASDWELDDLAREIASDWGAELTQYYWDLCRRVGLCD